MGELWRVTSMLYSQGSKILSNPHICNTVEVEANRYAAGD